MLPVPCTTVASSFIVSPVCMLMTAALATRLPSAPVMRTSPVRDGFICLGAPVPELSQFSIHTAIWPAGAWKFAYSGPRMALISTDCIGAPLATQEYRPTVAPTT